MANAKAAVVFCVDPRLSEAHMEEFARIKREELGGENADMVVSAGSVSAVLANDDFGKGVIANVGAASALHHISEIWVIEHKGCGYYGIQAQAGDTRFALEEENEAEVHGRNARAAVAELQERYPNITAAHYRLASLDGTIENL
jgi:carbonic anhydrase